MAHLYTADQFGNCAGRTFRAQAGGPDLTLVRVDAGNDDEARLAAGLPPSFTVIFRGPPQPVLPEGLHTLESPAADSDAAPQARDQAGVGDAAAFAVHIMPIHTPWAHQQDYQVVFG